MLKQIFSLLFLTLSLSVCVAQDDDINSLIIGEKYELATQKINNILIDNPLNMNARFQYATILSLTHKTDQAIGEYNKILKDYPNTAEAYNNLGVLYSQQELYEKSLQSFQEAIFIKPRYNTAIENLGDLYIQMAFQSYRKVLANDINNESALLKYIKTKSMSIELNTDNLQKIIKI